MLSPKIIALEEGWNNEIKAKAIDVAGPNGDYVQGAPRNGGRGGRGGGY